MSKKEKEFKQLCVWYGTTLGDNTSENFVEYMKNEFNVDVKFAEVVITNPDLDKNDNPVPDTGGRSDLFFWVASKDISKFAIPRLQAGIRWWEDVVSYNDNSYLYSKEVLDKYPVTW